MIKYILSCVLFLIPVTILADAPDGELTLSADPAVQVLIDELGLRESTIASRDLEGWSPPKKIVVMPFRADSLADLQTVARR